MYFGRYANNYNISIDNYLSLCDVYKAEIENRPILSSLELAAPMNIEQPLNNPNIGSFILKTSDQLTQSCLLRIFDILGHEIYSEILYNEDNSITKQISIPTNISGHVILQLIDMNNNLISNKLLIIQRK